MGAPGYIKKLEVKFQHLPFIILLRCSRLCRTTGGELCG